MILLIQGSLCPEAKAQAEYALQNINVDKGLNQSTINDLFIDKKGFIWAATQDGLSKYDGYRFVTYRHNPLDSSTISSNSIQGICEDEYANLWISTETGLNKMLRIQDRFSSSFPTFDRSMFGTSPNITDIVKGRNNVLWMKIEHHLIRYDILKNSFNYFEMYNDYFNVVSDVNFNGMIEDSNGGVWIPTKDGLNYFDTELEQMKRFVCDPNDKNTISTQLVRVVFEDSKQNIYIGTENGLNIYNPRKKTFQEYRLENRGKDINIITTIFEDNKGTIWLGTKDGLAYFDKQNKKITQSLPQCIPLAGINIKKVTKIIQENNGTYWIGTENDGLFKLEFFRKKFNLINNTTSAQKLPSEDIASIFEDDNKNLWIGTWGAGLVIKDRQTNILEYFNKENKRLNLPDNFIHVIFKDSQNAIWIGTRNGIVFFNEKKKVFESLDQHRIKGASYFRSNKVNCIFEDRDRTIWVGTQNGLFRMENNEFKPMNIKHISDVKFGYDEIRSIAQAKDNRIWIGTQKGIVVLDKKNNRKTFYRKITGDTYGISNNSVRCIYVDKQGTIWVGTDSGLNKFNEEDNQFSFFNQSNGFINDYIYNILEDNNRNLWMGTNHGLARINIDSQRVRCFDTFDGLQDYEFNSGAAYKSKDDQMFFGGPKGLNHFYPDSIFANTQKPTITLTSVTTYTRKGEIHTIHADNLEEIFITNDIYMFSLEFAALDFTRPEKNMFQYKLDNEQETWVDIRNQHSVSFNGLSKGIHYIYIKGSNNDEYWNHEGIKLKVVVESTVWNSNLAYFAYILLVVVLITIIIRARTSQLSKANQFLTEKDKISQQVEIQKKELETKNQNITDSMHYAQRIIYAMTPSLKQVKRSFNEFFVFYQPKDIVSGDFYWFGEINEKLAIAAIDCTGHGIPGAFMSIIGFDLLRNITKNKAIDNPAEILNQLNKGVAETFKDNEESQVNDGMDLAFCVIDRKRKILEYAGAFNPIYIVRDNNIIELKGDRFAVGLASQNQSFTLHTMELFDEDMIYMFSDGYVDQFGGPQGKKFKTRRFRHILLNIHKLPLSNQQEILKSSFDNWKGELEQVDDILVIGLKPLK